MDRYPLAAVDLQPAERLDVRTGAEQGELNPGPRWVDPSLIRRAIVKKPHLINNTLLDRLFASGKKANSLEKNLNLLA